MKVTDEDVYRAVVALRRELGYSPTVCEIGERTGLHSTCAAWAHLRKLRAAKRITWVPCCPRTITVIDN